jgi:hypothetical protein
MFKDLIYSRIKTQDVTQKNKVENEIILFVVFEKVVFKTIKM